MLLAHHLWDLLDRDGADAGADPVARALDRAVAEVADVCEAAWTGFGRPERIVVAALADGRPPVSTAVAREHGIARSTLQSAVERLEADGQHVVRGRDGRPWLQDPLLGEWLRRR